MKFFSYICNCVALDTGMCDFIPPKFHLIPPKNFLFCTWGFRNIHVEITFPRYSPVSIRL